jgi:hypothetical protein
MHVGYDAFPRELREFAVYMDGALRHVELDEPVNNLFPVGEVARSSRGALELYGRTAQLRLLYLRAVRILHLEGLGLLELVSNGCARSLMCCAYDWRLSASTR